MNETGQTPTPGAPTTKPVKFAFEKDAGFRTVYAMGAWGRINGNNDIVLSLYQELPPLPLIVTFEMLPDGTWKKEKPKMDMPADYQVVRQIEVDVILSLEAAKKIQDSLTAFIAAAEVNRLKMQQKTGHPVQTKTL